MKLNLIPHLIPTSEEAAAHKSIYNKHLSNWSYLSAFLSLSNPGIEITGYMLRIELDGKCRPDILNRLSGRMTTQVREQLKAFIASEAINKSMSKKEKDKTCVNALSKNS